ncbi:MAG TPA: hypothetical protein VIM86_08060 [Thermodesulfobacteriota bacterium]
MTDDAHEARARLAERAAALERRAMQAYRALAARFGGLDSGRRFAEMADGEAQHFAVLNLSGDFVRMATDLPAAAPESEADLDAAEPLVAALEAAATADPQTGLPAAVEAAVRFEQQELPRVAAVIAALPEPARGKARAGIGRTLPGHYAALEALARAAGRDDLAADARALAASAARL